MIVLDESRRRLLALLETMDACAAPPRRARGRCQIVAAAATLPKGLPHTPVCGAQLDERDQQSHSREVQSFDPRRHHSPLTTDEPRE